MTVVANFGVAPEEALLVAGLAPDGTPEPDLGRQLRTAPEVIDVDGPTDVLNSSSQLTSNWPQWDPPSGEAA